ncbi:MAG: hypothetical protein ABSC94_17955 [Polyangiaceae bacterium]|jgi:hypothetical protein
MKRSWVHAVAVSALALALATVACSKAKHAPTDPNVYLPPQPGDWADLARLPDWGGVWNPNISDQNARIKTDPVPWKPEVEAEIARLNAEEHAGRPKGLFVSCLPEGMPSWMLITHNAIEFLYSPGRVTILGESDGNRIRRIYTDGRSHPDDPDPSFHGHSIGHWEGPTLHVDTVGILPEVYLAVSEAVGIPNNGDLHVVEDFHLASPDVLQDDIEITAPRILTRPWKTTRSYFRQRAKKYDIVEGVCLEGYFARQTDQKGYAVFAPIPQTEGGNPVAAKR